MSFIYYNPNPLGLKTSGDCTVRAISKVLNQSWEKTYADLCAFGFRMAEIPNANRVWGVYLLEHGFEEHSLLRKCRECYTVNDFCLDYPTGTYVVGTNDHAIAIIDGDIWDLFDSGDMYPMYYFEKLNQEGSD